MDFEEMPEPNMKLSRALLIVLLLHVVAVSGIIAFNAIKTRESSFVSALSTSAEPKPSATVDAAIHTGGAKPQTAAAQKENAPRDDAKPSHSPSKLSSKNDHANAPSVANRPSHKPTANQEATAGEPVSSGKTYVVKKGDNPVTIAKKLKVPYDDLMALNHIEDPRKLRIGQKLLIPKTTKPKATNGKPAKPKEKKNEVRHTKQQGRST
jgi:LysM repeat protein